jgi:hypothetical protein
MENWKSHKWEIFLIPEHTIKTYKNINNNKFRPVIVLSNAR